MSQSERSPGLLHSGWKRYVFQQMATWNYVAHVNAADTWEPRPKLKTMPWRQRRGLENTGSLVTQLRCWISPYLILVWSFKQVCAGFFCHLHWISAHPSVTGRSYSLKVQMFTGCIGIPGISKSSQSLTGNLQKWSSESSSCIRDKSIHSFIQPE